MKIYREHDFPVADIRRFLEPGPVVLVSSAWHGERNIMTMGWHMVMEFTPSLVGCLISSGNHSYDLVSRSKECVINVPTVELAPMVAQHRQLLGRRVDKFEPFKLTAATAGKVKAPLIAECYANLECRLVDGRLRDKGTISSSSRWSKRMPGRGPKYPKTIHYRGEGMFMVAGRSLNLRRRYRRLGML